MSYTIQIERSAQKQLAKISTPFFEVNYSSTSIISTLLLLVIIVCKAFNFFVLKINIIAF